MTECVVLIGLPGAGKTTFYRSRFAGTHLHISKDLWPNARGREARQQRRLEEALARGESVVVDNTNPSRAGRAPIVAAARAHGARVVAYFFDVPTRVAVARNAQREGRGRVPPVAIFTVAKRLEPPAFEEGFDGVFHVRVLPDRTMEVTEVSRRQ